MFAILGRVGALQLVLPLFRPLVGKPEEGTVELAFRFCLKVYHLSRTGYGLQLVWKEDTTTITTTTITTTTPTTTPTTTTAKPRTTKTTPRNERQ